MSNIRDSRSSATIRELSLDLEEIHINEGNDLVTYNPHELPSSLIVACLPICVFTEPEQKAEFETAFKSFDEEAKFYYLKSFRRARIDFSSSRKAAQARIQMHGSDICGQLVKCYFAQPWFRASGKEGEEHLQPPPLEKQFLISPPTSPPPGWSQAPEATPKINFDLLTAIAAMEPGEVHELFHPEKSSQPSITVEVVEDTFKGPKPQIVHTRRPDSESL